MMSPPLSPPTQDRLNGNNAKNIIESEKENINTCFDNLFFSPNSPILNSKQQLKRVGLKGTSKIATDDEQEDKEEDL